MEIDDILKQMKEKDKERTEEKPKPSRSSLTPKQQYLRGLRRGFKR